MVSLLDVHCFEQLNVEHCFGSCFGRRKRRSKRKTGRDEEEEKDDDDDDDDDVNDNIDKIKDKFEARPGAAKRRFSSVPQVIAEPLTAQLPSVQPHFIGPRITPLYYGVSAQPRMRYDNAQVVSIRRRKRHKHSKQFDSDSSSSNNTPFASIRHIRVRPRPTSLESWTARAPRQPIDFKFGSGEYSICLVNLEKVVSHVSGNGFTSMMRHSGNDTPGQTMTQMFTSRFAELMNMLFETSITRSAPSAICIVCENMPRNIISYPIVVKENLQGLMFLWFESSPHQELAEMITSA